MNRVECEGKYYVRLLANEVPIQLDLPSAFDTTFDFLFYSVEIAKMFFYNR